MNETVRDQSSIPTALGESCQVAMIENKPCGRPLLGAAIEGVFYCLMHAPQDKDNTAFQKEFERTLDGAAGTRGADFTRFVFPSANYEGREFKVNCGFFHAVFKQNAQFGNVVFEQGVDFIEATFEQDADFRVALFKGDANFTDATFAQDADFHMTTFEQDANFRSATFTRAASFEAAKFLGAAAFRETKFREDGGLFSGPVFSSAEFSRPASVIFYKTHMGQALFHNCDVSKITFSAVEWRKRKNGDKRNGKRMVFEEEVALDDRAARALRLEKGGPGDRDYGLIAELYHQLKKNYDECKDYWTAGDFHHGEMEMQRLRCRARNLRLMAWYKYASQYGESYMRPALALLFALIIFTLLFPLAGLDRNDNPSHSVTGLLMQQTSPITTSELSYRRFSDFVAAYPGRKWFGYGAFFGNSLMTAMSVASFQKEFKYEPRYPWGRALALLEVSVTSTLIALFLLAVRRQFRR